MKTYKHFCASKVIGWGIIPQGNSLAIHEGQKQRNSPVGNPQQEEFPVHSQGSKVAEFPRGESPIGGIPCPFTRVKSSEILSWGILSKGNFLSIHTCQRSNSGEHVKMVTQCYLNNLF
jgi:hypothetical protein